MQLVCRPGENFTNIFFDMNLTKKLGSFPNEDIFYCLQNDLTFRKAVVIKWSEIEPNRSSFTHGLEEKEKKKL